MILAKHLDRKAFFSSMRASFGALTQSQVDGTGVILDVIESRPEFPLPYAAYILATAWHETAKRMQPVRETLADSDDKVIAILDKAWRLGKLPQVKAPYWRRDAKGQCWFGRGTAQVTHKPNYSKAKAMTGIPFTDNPNLMLDPRASAVVLVLGMETGMFTGKRLADYLSGRINYVGARHIINGNDCDDTVARYARAFEAALKAAVKV